MARRSKKIICNITISGIADRGKAVGRSAEGEVVFVDEAVPGDLVDVLVLRKKNGVSHGVVVKYHQYSKDRIIPQCNHFGVCGGCKWQNLEYKNQLQHKEQIVKDCVRRIGKINPDLVMPIIGCDQNFQYRNKLEFSFSTKRWITKEEAESDEVFQDKPSLGFHKAGFFDKIVDIESCWLQDDFSNTVRNFVRSFCLQNDYTFYDIRKKTGIMRNMFLRNTIDGQWMVNIVFGQNDVAKMHMLLNALVQQFPNLTSVNYVINTKANDSIFDQEIMCYHGKPYIEETLGTIKYRIGPKSFFQTNPRQAKVLFDTALEFANLRPTDNVYDLYTGLGSIALYMADKVKSVTGIEEVPEAIHDANINSSLNNISNVNFYCGDVKHLLTNEFIQAHGKADVIITDPPRIGMHENVVQTLLDLEVPRIVYISCNPATQARDLHMLSSKYDVVALRPVDMFPHTHHIECVASLILKSKT